MRLSLPILQSPTPETKKPLQSISGRICGHGSPNFFQSPVFWHMNTIVVWSSSIPKMDVVVKSRTHHFTHKMKASSSTHKTKASLSTHEAKASSSNSRSEKCHRRNQTLLSHLAIENRTRSGPHQIVIVVGERTFNSVVIEKQFLIRP